jgi:arylsulfatase A-like enzyme
MDSMSRLRARAAVVVLSLVCLSAAPHAPPRPNIILIVIDTLRFDAVTPETTPFLASLAHDNVEFTRAYSTHDFTPTSHFSMMTGLRDGIDGNFDRAEYGVPWQLRTSGYDTFAASANDIISPKDLPVMAGFARFKRVWALHPTEADFFNEVTKLDVRMAEFQCAPNARNRAMLYASAKRLLPIFADQLRAAKAPYFGFVNLLDAHEPFVPDPDYYPPEKEVPPGFNGDVLKRRMPRELEHPETVTDPKRRAYVQSLVAAVKFPRLVAIDLSPAALDIYHRRYLGKVKKTDAMLRAFFDTMNAEHRLDDTIVIITSDHGEEFGESHYITHMLQDKGDYEATHHVPLIVVMPRAFGVKPARIDRIVGIDMIAPTLYQLARVDDAPLRKQLRSTAPSVVSLFTRPARPVTAVVVPKNAPRDAAAATEREKALRALGYIN